MENLRLAPRCDLVQSPKPIVASGPSWCTGVPGVLGWHPPPHRKAPTMLHPHLQKHPAFWSPERKISSFLFLQATGKRHSSALNEDKLSCSYTKLSSVFILFPGSTPSQKNILAFFYIKSNALLVIPHSPHPELLRKQRKSLLSKLSPTGTKNQITTVNIYSVFPNLSPWVLSFKSFFLFYLFESLPWHWKALDLHFTEEEKKLKEVMGLPQRPTLSKCLTSDSNPDSLAS